MSEFRCESWHRCKEQCDPCRLLEAAEIKLGAVERALQEMPALIPTTWLDSLLTGPDSIPVNNEHSGVERLLTALKA